MLADDKNKPWLSDIIPKPGFSLTKTVRVGRGLPNGTVYSRNNKNHLTFLKLRKESTAN